MNLMTRIARHAARGVLLVSSACMLPACGIPGAVRLGHDQVDYARALADARKRQTLAAMVGMRYADAPAFLSTTQIIAAYQFDTSGSAQLNTGADAGQHTSAQVGTTVAYANHPTFTFTPVTGDAYARTYIRPLAPTLVVPIAQGGAPIDVLFRLSLESLGRQRNSGLLGGDEGDGTEGFFAAIHALRRLQVSGALNIIYRAGEPTGKVFLQFDVRSSKLTKESEDDIGLVRRLLDLDTGTDTYEVVYGRVAPRRDQLPVLTRSILGILQGLGAQVEVPADEVAKHATRPTIHHIGVETRPVIWVRSGRKMPADAYVGITYEDHDYWVDYGDFDSKYAFSVLQNLMSLAEGEQNAAAPVVTIPAG